MIADFERTLSDGKAGLGDFLASIEGHLEGAEIDPGVSMKAMIAFDEIISNVLNHGSEGGFPEVVVRISSRDGELQCEIEDNGVAFDPLEMPAPDTTQSVEDRPIGGLGIHLVRELMDRVEYARIDDRNRLRFAKVLQL